MNQEKGPGPKLLLVIAAVAVVALVLYALRPGKDAEVATEKLPDTKPIAVKEEPKPVVEAKVEPPKEEPKPAAEQPAENADAMKAALLGLDKKPKSGGIQDLAERAQQRSTTNATTRTRSRPTEEKDEPLTEEKSIGLSDATFYSTIERWRGVKSCLSSGTVRKDEGEQGALRISLKINKTGEVSESRVTEPSNELARLIAPCVERSAKQLRFPAFDGEESVTKVAKFVF